MELEPVISNRYRIVRIFILLLGVIRLKAQDIDGVSSFLVAGVGMDIPKRNKLLIYAGFSPTDNVKALLVLPNFKVNKYLILTPGYTHVNVGLENGSKIVENQLLAMATLSFPIAENWTLADRNMYFHRFRNKLDDLSFYRNRLGLSIKQKFLKSRSAFFYMMKYIWALITDGLPATGLFWVATSNCCDG